MLRLDGSVGEGGGQLLRSALTLSAATGRPFRMEGVRAGRQPPGLRRQHVAAARAAAEISGARLEGDAPGSTRVAFRPSSLRGGRFAFDVGGAGSAVLVLQTVLPALVLADRPSDVTVRGGTHNPFAPPFEFLQRAYLPAVRRMGVEASAALDRRGFFPAGGGLVRCRVRPGELVPLSVHERGEEVRRRARAVVAGLPRHIADRELSVARAALDLDERDVELVEDAEADGPGNALIVEVECEEVTEVFAGFGRRGVPAESVATETCREALRYIESGTPVGTHLADQLLVPMGLAGGGSFTTREPTSHTETNAIVIRRFLQVDVDMRETNGKWRVAVG